MADLAVPGEVVHLDRRRDGGAYVADHGPMLLRSGARGGAGVALVLLVPAAHLVPPGESGIVGRDFDGVGGCCSSQ